ncbi:hypothetical protein FQN52_007939 [Onygenales sp. PD_12]|nr:hypothetical protein FQN52_007939 [Onygenales sp. PD_12]
MTTKSLAEREEDMITYDDESTLDVIKKLKNDVLELERRAENLQPYKESVWKIRKVILDSVASDKPDKAVIIKRNGVAHGGNIRADLEAIDDMGWISTTIADGWKIAFQKLYDVDYGFLKEHSNVLDTDIAELYNIYASVHSLDSWSTPSQEDIKEQVEETKEWVTAECKFCCTTWKIWCEGGMPEASRPSRWEWFNHRVTTIKQAYRTIDYMLD